MNDEDDDDDSSSNSSTLSAASKKLANSLKNVSNTASESLVVHATDNTSTAKETSTASVETETAAKWQELLKRTYSTNHELNLEAASLLNIQV
ncbi:hypothetical protein [Paenibacillus sp. N3.4]|uniref:hypothetical protein n=1 Tax=Paenibacillus sp. N3.4 TaxID=2603222 RepID=UPI0011C72C03|nr:hypothetical protein [Paenibacillus sp. N3.4]TXK82628.1 hypothetical protein FU659_14135 [Paenibacillus sp. N3.4]